VVKAGADLPMMRQYRDRLADTETGVPGGFPLWREPHSAGKSASSSIRRWTRVAAPHIAARLSARDGANPQRTLNDVLPCSSS
jgi:hypothetical protein